MNTQPAMNTVAAKCRPIMFSTAMVEAILADRKTQTRRVVTPQPTPCFGYSDERDLKWDVADGIAVRTDEACARYIAAKYRNPYGAAGDSLWVRETFHAVDDDTTWYRAGAFRPANARGEGEDKIRWTSGRFMPRRRSRIALEITDVRVQRLQDIDVNDVCAEGAPIYDDSPNQTHAVLDWFETLWDDINGKTYPWKSNPWIWAITFKRVASLDGGGLGTKGERA